MNSDIFKPSLLPDKDKTEVVSLFVLGRIILIAFTLESFCSVVGLLQDVSVTALSPR